MLTSREVRGGTIELIILIKPKDTGDKKSKRRRDTEGNAYTVSICLFVGGAKGKVQVRRAKQKIKRPLFSQARGQEGSSGQ